MKNKSIIKLLDEPVINNYLLIFHYLLDGQLNFELLLSVLNTLCLLYCILKDDYYAQI